LNCGIFRSQSIDPESKLVLGIKSTHQFRATFEPIAREVLLVDAGGLTSRNLANLPYRNVRRPVWSLDED
jgi:microcystin degradation protein MlrC